MRVLYFFISLLPFFSQAIDSGNFAQNDHTEIQKILIQKEKTYKSKLEEHFKVKEEIFEDPENRVSDEFIIPDYIRESVTFWFKIYTLYDSKYSIIHDKDQLGLVYDAIDFSELYSNDIHRFTSASIQNRLVGQETQLLKVALTQMAEGKSGGDREKRILEALARVKIEVPKDKKKKKLLFKNLAKNVRIQTGQKDFIQQGIINFKPFKDNLDHLFDLAEIPKELAFISFLESSFNTSAVSKVGASGVWQFMKSIGKHFFEIDSLIDHRINPLTATLGAIHLLKQNKKILKRWDLAVVAYNSGTKHIVRARKILGSEMTLKEYVEQYNHPHVGFASKNFFAEFLALAYALSYSDKFFQHSLNRNPVKNFVHFYVTKCKMTPNWFFSKISDSPISTKDLNLHFLPRSLNRNLAVGSIIVSGQDLNDGRYHLVKDKELFTYYPKNFKNFVKNQKCSIK